MSVNHETSKKGTARAVCEFCGKRSQWVRPEADGEPALLWLGRGWSMAPFPADYAHKDGSHGSQFCCPACNKQLKNGARLKTRNDTTVIRLEGDYEIR